MNNQKAVSEALTGEDYQVHQACDGGEAIKLFECLPTDFVITDLVMLGKEGLAISGGGRAGSQDYLKMAKAFGAKRVLAKSFSHRKMLEALNQVLDQEEKYLQYGGEEVQSAGLST